MTRDQDYKTLSERHSPSGWGAVQTPEERKVSENYPTICNATPPWVKKGQDAKTYLAPITETFTEINLALREDETALENLSPEKLVNAITRLTETAGFVVSAKELAKVRALLALANKEQTDVSKRLRHSK